MSTRTKQVLMVVVTALCGAAIEVFGPKGPWSHAFWAPVAVALLTELRTAMGLSAQPTVSVAEVKARVTGAVPPVGPVVALLLVLSLGVSGCATVPTSDGGVSPTTAYGHCATQALTQAAEGILGDVTTALATGNYESAIASLAVKVGGAEVGCAIDLVIAQFTTKAARTDDAMVGVVLAHAQQFRQEHP